MSAIKKPGPHGPGFLFLERPSFYLLVGLALMILVLAVGCG